MPAPTSSDSLHTHILAATQSTKHKSLAHPRAARHRRRAPGNHTVHQANPNQQATHPLAARHRRWRRAAGSGLAAARGLLPKQVPLPLRGLAGRPGALAPRRPRLQEWRGTSQAARGGRVEATRRRQTGSMRYAPPRRTTQAPAAPAKQCLPPTQHLQGAVKVGQVCLESVPQPHVGPLVLLVESVVGLQRETKWSF